MSLDRRKISGKTHQKPLPYDLHGSFTKLKFMNLFPIIEASLDDNRQWVADFQHDEIYVPNDLSDVISAYEHFYGQIGNSRG